MGLHFRLLNIWNGPTISPALIDVKYHILAPNTSNKADVLSCSVDIIQWMAVLKSCSALEAFKKVHLSRIQPENILEFLILDKTFPRSIHFSIGAAKESLWRLSGNSTQKISPIQTGW